MKKYLEVYKSVVMSTFQYILDILFELVGYALHIFIFFNLWNYIYDDPSQLINGYQKSQMIWYVIFTEILWKATSGRTLCRRISDDVRGGNIAYLLNKPYSYINYLLASHLGWTTIKTFISIVVGFLLGIIFLKDLPYIPIAGVLVLIISSFLAVLISDFLVIFIGLVSFFIEDSAPLYWLYSKMILVIGVMFPLEFFPEVIQPIVKLSPIYVTCYGPAKLFVDFNYGIALEIIIAQVIYLVVAVLSCFAIYKKGVKKLNVNGG